MRRFKGHVLIALAAILWGSTSISISYALMSGVDYLAIATITTSIGALFIGLYAGKEGFNIVRLDLIIYGALVIATFRALYALSVLINGAGITASLLYTAPLLVALIAPLTIREKPSILDVLLAIIAVFGAYFSSNPELRITSVLGFLVGMALATVYAITIIAIKYFYSKGYSKKEILIQSTIAAIPTLTLLTIVTESKVVLSYTALLALLWGGIISIGVALIIYMEGMKIVKAIEASVIATLEPVSALILASLILGERYVLIQLIGIVLIMISAVIITVKDYISHRL